MSLISNVGHKLCYKFNIERDGISLAVYKCGGGCDCPYERMGTRPIGRIKSIFPC